MSDPKDKHRLPRKPVARRVLKAVAPPIDKASSRKRHAAGSDAHRVKPRKSIRRSVKAPKAEPPVGRLGRTILRLLRDRKPWRLKHLVDAVGAGTERSLVANEVYRLWDSGHIFRARHGVFLLAGTAPPRDRDILPLHDADAVSPSHKKILELLSKPTLVLELLKHVSVSRQRVDQILEILERKGKVRRVPEPGSPSRWLWFRSDIDPQADLKQRLPRFEASRAMLLSVLRPGELHSAGDLARVLRTNGGKLRALAIQASAQRLISTFRLGPQLYVGITPRGMQHPERNAGVEAAPIADPTRTLDPLRIAFIEALAVLKQATSLDLIAALAPEVAPGNRLMLLQLLSRLLHGYLVERVERVGLLPQRYRLSQSGRFAMTLLSRTRTPPGRDELERRIASYQASRTERLQNGGKRLWSSRTPPPDAADSPAGLAILAALAAHPLATPALSEAIRPHAKAHRMVYIVLDALRRRGAIKAVGRQGRVFVWALVDRRPTGSAGSPAPSEAVVGKQV